MSLASYVIVLEKQAVRDLENIKKLGLKNKVDNIISLLHKSPYSLPYEKLNGNLKGYYSRRINLKHRLVYKIIEQHNTIKILRMWSHYE